MNYYWIMKAKALLSTIVFGLSLCSGLTLKEQVNNHEVLIVSMWSYYEQ